MDIQKETSDRTYVEKTSLWSASRTLTPTVIREGPGSPQTCDLVATAVHCSRLRETHPTDLVTDKGSTGPTRPLVTLAFCEMVGERVFVVEVQDPPLGGWISVGGKAPRPLPKNPCARDKDIPSPPQTLVKRFATHGRLYVFVTTRVMYRL